MSRISGRSHIRIVRAAGTLRNRPGDVLRRVLDIAGFAVDAVLGVDLETRVGAIRLPHDFIHARRAVALRRLVESRQVIGDRNGRILELQMDRLVFFVVGRRQEDRGELVEGYLAVRLRIVDRLALGRLFQRLVIRLAMLQREGKADSEIVHPHVEAAQRHADDGAEARQEGLHVADALQVLVYRAAFISLGIGRELIRLAARLHSIEGRFRAHHAGEHGVMAALDAGHVDEACRAADQRAAREGELRHGLEAAFGDGARAIGDALAAFECLVDCRMLLEALELVEGREIGVLVVEVDDEAYRHQILAEVIEERAAASRVVERPAQRVLNLALACASSGRSPKAP